MIFKIIINKKYRPGFKLLISLLVFSILSSVIGCTTTGSHLIRNDKLSSQTDYEILRIQMKSGQIIDMRGKSAHYVKEYEGKKNLIFYSSSDTIISLKDSLEIFSKEKTFPGSDDTIPVSNSTLVVAPTIRIIELEQVRWITIEKTELDVGKTALIVVAAVTLIIIFYFILDANSDNENDSDYKDYNRNENCTDCPDYNRNNYTGNVHAKLLNLSPKNKSVNIPRLVLLKWDYTDSETGDLRFDVYADYQNPPEKRVAQDISEKSYELGSVEHNRTIYWQIIAKVNGNTVSESPVWYFTTVK